MSELYLAFFCTKCSALPMNGVSEVGEVGRSLNINSTRVGLGHVVFRRALLSDDNSKSKLCADSSKFLFLDQILLQIEAQVHFML